MRQNNQETPRRPRTLLKPRTKKPNFVVSAMVMSVRMTVLVALMVMVAGVGLVLGIVKAYTETAPELNLARIDDQAQTSFFYDAQGNLITDYKGTEDRVMVSIEDIPVMLQNAFISIEDERFRSHNGVDPKRIVGSFISNLSSDKTQGGSTITQQLLKISILSDEQSYKRKIQEAYLAMQLEKIYTKDQILESYLNTIFLGESYYGVKTAAYGYFGKELEQLTLRECAMLAGTARSPYYYNARRNIYLRETPNVANDRADYVLHTMYENQFITYEQYQAALNQSTMAVLEQSPNSGAGMYEYPYYVEYAIQDVIDELLTMNSLENTSANRTLMENKLRTGGYHVYLCLDTEMQRLVENMLATWNDYPLLRDPSDAVYRQRNRDGTYMEVRQPQAAAVIFDYRSGELKAIVGGRDTPTMRKTLNRATDMTMPVGSAIKPISVYAPAIELGQSPATIVYNMPVPIHGWNDGGGTDYYPSNYGGGGFTGPVTFRKSVRQSYNTSAAQAFMVYVGLDRGVQYLKAMGVKDNNIQKTPFGMSLGASGITPVQMAVAYGAIANGGVYQQATSFSRIEDSDGNILVDRNSSMQRRIVFKESTAWLVVDMLKEVISNGTGTSAKISGQTVAGKTGTNSDYKGVSFAGMTGWYSCAVWVGHDNYKALYSKATGGNSAAPLWQAIMEKVHTMKGLQNRDIIDKEPEAVGLQKVTTCGVSGLLATQACANDVNGYGTVTDYWPVENMPQHNCNMHQELTLCSDSGMLATEFCPSTRTKSAVIIPIGHPLYNFIDEYRSTMTKYLGEFAGLKLTENNAYNQTLIDQLTCQRHSQTWVDEAQYWQQDGNVEEAQSLLSYAYDMLTNRGSQLTMEEYVSVSYCIRQVEVILESYVTDGLTDAISDLRYALTVFN